MNTYEEKLEKDISSIEKFGKKIKNKTRFTTVEGAKNALANKRVKVLLRKVGGNPNYWFATVRVDKDFVTLFHSCSGNIEDLDYTLCFDTAMRPSVNEVKKLAKEFCEFYGYKISKYVNWEK